MKWIKKCFCMDSFLNLKWGALFSGFKKMLVASNGLKNTLVMNPFTGVVSFWIISVESFWVLSVESCLQALKNISSMIWVKIYFQMEFFWIALNVLESFWTILNLKCGHISNLNCGTYLNLRCGTILNLTCGTI